MKRAWLAGTLALLSAAAPAGSDSEPGGYSLRLPITAAGGAGVQSLALPAAVLAALQTPDGRDVRVFDAAGRPLPIARLPAAAMVAQHAVAPLPILGARDALRVSDVSLRLDGDGRARVVTMSGAPVPAGGARTLLGVLLDTRALNGPADRLLIAASLPAGQPVAFTVEAGRDLRTWRTLGETTVYRSPGEPTRPIAVPLPGAALAKDYLRITWRTDARLLAPIEIQRTELVTRKPVTSVSIAAMPPPLSEPRSFAFALPFGTPVADIRVTPATHGPAIVPIRVLGRDHDEQPWAVLGTGVAAAGEHPRGLIRLAPAAVRTMRIEADPRSPGFAAAPAISFGFAPSRIMFVATYARPLTLAAGRAGAADAYLSSADLTGGRVVSAQATVTAPQKTLQLVEPDEGGRLQRKALLWTILAVATAMLGAMAWWLWRSGARAPGSE